MATPSSPPGSCTVAFPFSAGPGGCHLLIVSQSGVHTTLQLQGIDWLVTVALSCHLVTVECKGCQVLVTGRELITTVSPPGLLRYRCTCMTPSPVKVILPVPEAAGPLVNPGCIPQGAYAPTETPEPAPETRVQPPESVPVCPECKNTGKVQLLTTTQPCKMCDAKIVETVNHEGIGNQWKVKFATPLASPTTMPFYAKGWVAPLIPKGGYLVLRKYSGGLTLPKVWNIGS